MFRIAQFAVVVLFVSFTVAQQATPVPQAKAPPHPSQQTKLPKGKVPSDSMPPNEQFMVLSVRPANKGQCQPFEIRLSSEDKKVYCLRPGGVPVVPQSIP